MGEKIRWSLTLFFDQSGNSSKTGEILGNSWKLQIILQKNEAAEVQVISVDSKIEDPAQYSVSLIRESVKFQGLMMSNLDVSA